LAFNHIKLKAFKSLWHVSRTTYHSLPILSSSFKSRLSGWTKAVLPDNVFAVIEPMDLFATGSDARGAAEATIKTAIAA
jgi:hypothetical protein